MELVETLKQRKLITVVIFKPSHKTLHAIKAKYNHLITQRTQLYGNLWYKEYSSEYKWSGLNTSNSLAGFTY